jgi:hypothetical protein
MEEELRLKMTSKQNVTSEEISSVALLSPACSLILMVFLIILLDNEDSITNTYKYVV